MIKKTLITLLLAVAVSQAAVKDLIPNLTSDNLDVQTQARLDLLAVCSDAGKPDHEQVRKAVCLEICEILSSRQDEVLVMHQMLLNLERIGDEAAKVAKQVVRLSEGGTSPSNFIEIKHIGTRVSAMLRQALDAFARLDVNQAVAVVKDDAEVDKEYGSAMRSLVTFMMEDPRDIGAVLNEMWALRSLERIGDHACNIAEHVVYLVRGLDVRHGRLDELGEEILDRH